jgi:hypothetical protein
MILSKNKKLTLLVVGAPGAFAVPSVFGGPQASVLDAALA